MSCSNNPCVIRCSFRRSLAAFSLDVMQTGPILDCGAPAGPRSVAWLGGHSGVINAVDGEATLTCAMRSSLAGTSKRRLVTGGGDWAVCIWELEEGND